MNKLFRKPTIRELLQRELYAAQREQITADKMAAQWKAQAEFSRQRINSLRQQIQDAS